MLLLNLLKEVLFENGGADLSVMRNARGNMGKRPGFSLLSNKSELCLKKNKYIVPCTLQPNYNAEWPWKLPPPFGIRWKRE